MTFKDKWTKAVALKNSSLCAGLDPAEFGQRADNTLPEGADKVQWCLNFIETVAPYAAAVKINRNYIRDLSRAETKRLCDAIHHHGMVAIDDSKLADIGSTNASGFYHSAKEGFDAITYAPLPGNIAEAVKHAHDQGLGLIVLTILSNPEYKNIKTAQIEGMSFYQYIAKQVATCGADAIVIGAPSAKNHIEASEIAAVQSILPSDTLILVPGIGAQGGELELLNQYFKNRMIINVGRALMFAQDVETVAKDFSA